MRVAITICLGLVVVLLAIVGLHEVGAPSAVRPDDFEGTAEIAVLIDWAPDLQRIEEERTAWWWPGCRQARHFYYGKSGQQLVWLEVLCTSYSDKTERDQEFERQSHGTAMAQISVNGQSYRFEPAPRTGPDLTTLVFSHNDETVGLRILQRRGFDLISTTLIGLYPVSPKERHRLLAVQ